jgi:hypothetical protein
MKRGNAAWLPLCALYALSFVSSSSGWDLKRDLLTPMEKKINSLSEANIVYRFIDDNFLSGDFTYIYPEGKSKMQIDNKVFKNGEASLRFDLDPDTFSGGAICLYNRTIDLRPYLKKGALQFWLKRAPGAEMAWVSLVDDNSDLKKTVVRVLAPYRNIGEDWSFVAIPLKEFNSIAVTPCYWDTTAMRELPHEFNWERVAEFRIESKKGENKSFRVWVDDVFIVKKQK